MTERGNTQTEQAVESGEGPEGRPIVRRGRRAIMLGAAAAGAGITAGLVAGAAPAEAANAGSVLLGKTNAASATTEIETTSGDAFQAVSGGSGIAVLAETNPTSEAPAVYGAALGKGAGVEGSDAAPDAKATAPAPVL
jgi:hypothetical protein